MMATATVLGTIGVISFLVLVFLIGHRNGQLKTENGWLRRKIDDLTAEIHRVESTNHDLYSELQAQRRGRGRPVADVETFEEMLDYARDFRYRIALEQERDEAKYQHWNNLFERMEKIATKRSGQ